jgi:hypothetical protein
MLDDGDYELVLGQDQGFSEDPANIVEELTETPNQSSEASNSCPHPHSRRQASDISHYFIYTAIYIYLSILMH